jgi:hypothetical protein
MLKSRDVMFSRAEQRRAGEGGEDTVQEVMD